MTEPLQRRPSPPGIRIGPAAAGTMVCVMVLATIAQLFLLFPISALGLVLAIAILMLVPGNPRIEPGSRFASCLFAVGGFLLNGALLIAI